MASKGAVVIILLAFIISITAFILAVILWTKPVTVLGSKETDKNPPPVSDKQEKEEPYPEGDEHPDYLGGSTRGTPGGTGGYGGGVGGDGGVGGGGGGGGSSPGNNVENDKNGGKGEDPDVKNVTVPTSVNATGNATDQARADNVTGSAASGNKTGDTGAVGDESPVEEPVEPEIEKTHIFAIGTANNPYELYDEAAGDIFGFHVDLIREVCRRAQKKCEFYANFFYKYCWDGSKEISPGLFEDWFDVCVGWAPTATRSRVFSFFGEMYSEPKVHFYAASSDIKEVKPSTQAIGFSSFHFPDSECVSIAYGESPKKEVIYNSFAEAAQGVKDGDVDLVPMIEGTFTEGLVKVGEPLECDLKGASMMTRKENTDKYQWFDDTLQELKADGTFGIICARSKLLYKSDIRCIETD